MDKTPPSTPGPGPTIRKNLRIAAKLDRTHFVSRTLSERLSEAIADFCGNIRFVAVHATIFVGWIAWNTGLVPHGKAFDPFPYMVLNLGVSLEAIFLSTFVMIQQNRMSFRDEQWARLEFQVNLLTERETTRTLLLVEAILPANEDRNAGGRGKKRFDEKDFDRRHHEGNSAAGGDEVNPFQAVEPETLQWIEAVAALGLRPVYELTVEEARANFTAAMTAAPSTRNVTTEDAVLDGVPVRIARPEGLRGDVPAAMYFHGGGWVLGNKAAHDRFIKELAYAAEATVVYVDFALSPEARFPVALEQCYTATKFVAARGGELGIEGSRLAVVGDSAGGGMAGVVAMLAKRRGGPAIRQQTLICPVTDAAFDTESYRRFGSGYPLTDEAMKWFWKHHAPDEAVRRSPLASPLRAEVEDLRGLPEAMVITAEIDVLRDEGEAYAHKLMEAGVKVAGTRYLGTVHNFMLPAAMAKSALARKAMAQIGAALREALRP